jgi:hypothetical protein
LHTQKIEKSFEEIEQKKTFVLFPCPIAICMELSDSLPWSHEMSYQASERRQQKVIVVFPAHVIGRISHTIFSILSTILHFTTFHAMESKLNSVETVAEVEVHRTINDQPVKDRKLKKQGW